MATLSVEIPRSALLQAVEQLDGATFDAFLDDVLLLKARRAAPNVNADAANLLAQINVLGLSATESARLNQLLEKAELGEQTSAENAEQQTLTDKSERANAQRMMLVLQLAQIWGKPVDTVLQQLGLLNQHGDA